MLEEAKSKLRVRAVETITSTCIRIDCVYHTRVVRPFLRSSVNTRYFVNHVTSFLHDKRLDIDPANLKITDKK